MATLAELFATEPSKGGLAASNRPAPYGLRAYKQNDGTYGGQMMPKWTGWAGVQNLPNGDVMTELSVGDEHGDFPAIYQGITPADLTQVVGGRVTEDIYNRARAAANKRRALGLNPFKDID